MDRMDILGTHLENFSLRLPSFSSPNLSTTTYTHSICIREVQGESLSFEETGLQTKNEVVNI